MSICNSWSLIWKINNIILLKWNVIFLWFSLVFFMKNDIPFSSFFSEDCVYVYEWWLRVYWSLIDYLQTFRQRLKMLASIVLKALILDKCWQVFVFVSKRCLHQFIQRLVNVNETIEDNVDFHLITSCYHVCFLIYLHFLMAIIFQDYYTTFLRGN